MNSLPVSPENLEVYDLFDRCNHTELYQIARLNHEGILPNYSRDALIRIIIGEENAPSDVKHPIDEWRRGLMKFLQDHRHTLEAQVECPAKSFKDDACSGCVDAQVLHCITANGPANLKQIELRKNALAKK